MHGSLGRHRQSAQSQRFTGQRRLKAGSNWWAEVGSRAARHAPCRKSDSDIVPAELGDDAPLGQWPRAGPGTTR